MDQVNRFDLTLLITRATLILVVKPDHSRLICGTNITTLDIQMHPYNYITYATFWKSLISISYRIEKLQYKDLNIPSDTTIKLQHRTSLQHFRINVNNTSALVRFSVREFHGYTYGCRYGGIYMYYKYHYVIDDSGTLHLHTRKMKNNDTRERRISYGRACTTETSAVPGSLVNEFYFEIGSTHIIFYSFLSMFTIDIQMKVLVTPCIAMTDVHVQYCEDVLQPREITTPHYNIICLLKDHLVLHLKSERCFIIQNFHMVMSELMRTEMYIHWLGKRDMNLSLTTDNITLIPRKRLSSRCVHALYFRIFSNLRVETFRYHHDVGATSVTTNLTNQVRELWVHEHQTCLLYMIRSVLFVGETLISEVACTAGTVQWVDMKYYYEFVFRSLCARLQVSFPNTRVIFKILTEFQYDMPSGYVLTYFYIIPNRECFLANGFQLRAFITSRYIAKPKWLVTEMNVRFPAIVFNNIGVFRTIDFYTIPMTIDSHANTTIGMLNRTSCKLYLEEEHHQITPWAKIVDHYSKKNEYEEFKVFIILTTLISKSTYGIEIKKKCPHTKIYLWLFDVTICQCHFQLGF